MNVIRRSLTSVDTHRRDRGHIELTVRSRGDADASLLERSARTRHAREVRGLGSCQMRVKLREALNDQVRSCIV